MYITRIENEDDGLRITRRRGTAGPTSSSLGVTLKGERVGEESHKERDVDCEWNMPDCKTSALPQCNSVLGAADLVQLGDQESAYLRGRFH